MPKDQRVVLEQIVVAAVQNRRVAVEVVVILQRVPKRVRTLGVPPEVDHAKRASADMHELVEIAFEMRGNCFIGRHAIPERHAAAEKHNAMLAGLLAVDRLSSIAPDVVSARLREAMVQI